MNEMMKFSVHIQLRKIEIQDSNHRVEKLKKIPKLSETPHSSAENMLDYKLLKKAKRKM